MIVEEEKELPKIRQTKFILPKNRQYLFDVNEIITINRLKRMIIVAANLDKKIRIFHDNIEYTDKDIYTLDQLFPDLQYIEFRIELLNQEIEEVDDIINIKLKSNCHTHKGKFPNFYCYTCGTSICIDCLRSSNHNDHNYKEKYDYFQESKDLIENLFKDLKELLNKTNGVPEEIIKTLKKKITIQFFPKLVDIVKQIENNMVNLILNFFEKDQNNYKMMQNNLVSLKNSCTEGLDVLKENIEIEYLMIDENIFKTFDSKFKNINNEKFKIKKDLETYKIFTQNLTLIQNIVEKTYNEIYDLLIKYSKITEFSDIKSKINIENISEINKKEILERILGDIKSTDKNSVNYVKLVNNAQKLKNEGKKEDIVMKDESKTSKKDKNKEKVENKDAKEKSVDTDYASELTSKDSKIKNGVNKTEKDLPDESFEEEGEIKNNYRRVLSIIPNSNKALVYYVSKKINKTKDVEFPNLLGIKYFLKDCSWVNYNNKLYILGGEEKGKKSHLFIEYDGIKNTFKKLPDSKYGHIHHSLFVYDNSIYCVGGKETECEKYDFETNTWTMLPKLIYVQENPVLYVYNNILYSFFGNDEKGKKIDSVQKLNLKNAKSKWMNVIYNKNGCNLKMSGCGIVKINDNCIYFFGGKTEEGTSKDAIEFDFSNMKANKTLCNLKKNAYFQDSLMVKVSENEYANYSLDQDNSIILVCGLT